MRGVRFSLGRFIVSISLVLAGASSGRGAELVVGNDNFLHVETRGTRGTDAWKEGVLFPDYHAATLGGNAAPIQVTLPTAGPDPVKVGGSFHSIGGAGGRGIDEGWDQGYPGARGGNGGAVTVVVGAMPDLEFAEGVAIGSFLSLRSVGGAGGAGDYRVGAGNGGNGGAVRLTLEGELELSEVVASPVVLESLGGAAGGGNRQAWRWDKVIGGAGGDVTFTLGEEGALRVTLADRSSETLAKSGYGYAVLAQSKGGSGVLESTASPSRVEIPEGQPARGGNAGAVNLTLNGEVSVMGIGNQAIFGLSEGGHGGDTYGFKGAAGGNAGRVSLVIGESGSIDLGQPLQPAVVLKSKGGDGGAGLTFLTVASEGGGGNGGVAPRDSVFFWNRGEISSYGDLSPAVVLESLGGHGGNATRTGRGGDGGNAGNILARNEGTISTYGKFGFGLVARSAGGPGGDGGTGGSRGGDGGNGGDAGSVEIQNSGVIETFGQGAFAIIGQSIGGGGTTSTLDHLDFSLVASPASESGGRGGEAGGLFSFLAKGGEGGRGGSAGDIRVENRGQLWTAGDNASAVFLQSLGGGGGIGGSATAKSLVLTVAGGGNGGMGGNGGRIDILTTEGSLIQTDGISSAGIAAYSVGGGGGNAGNADASSYSAGFGLSIAIGGDGAAGGRGGDITVVNGGRITTNGVDSRGIELFSIGGAGGSGGQATAESVVLGTPRTPAVSLSLAIGGGGAKGGNGGNIKIENRGDISTAGDQSIGIYAMSIGGGGGNGGNATAVAASMLKGMQANVAVALGGIGGAGGTGGKITMNELAGTITTRGQNAHGVFLMSVGGGGGNGGVGQGVADTGVLTAQSLGVSVSIGGAGGGKGAGGDVSVENASAFIRTTGDDAVGVLLQSVGGGGGSAYLGALTATAGFDRTKDAIKGTTVLDGNGGNAKSSSTSFGTRANIAIGGAAGAAGEGGNVSFKGLESSRIETSGANSHGIFAQSVGGGGGIGGGASAATDVNGLPGQLLAATDGINSYGQTIFKLLKKIGVTTVPGFILAANGEVRRLLSLNEEQEKTPSLSFNLALGGSGGASGNGGNVKVDHKGGIQTDGFSAHGIFAQSVGGGGGQGGAGSSSGSSTYNFGLSVGGEGGKGGKGGEVHVVNTGGILTRGMTSYGILAQSVGGGGGTGGAATPNDGKSLALSGAIAVGLGGDGGNKGVGGKVTVVNDGIVVTEGLESHGIVAQSVGGGGGIVTFDLSSLAEVATSQGGSASGVRGSPVGIRFSIGGRGGDGASGGDVSVTNRGTIVTKHRQAFGILAQSVGGGGGVGGGMVTLLDEEKAAKMKFEEKLAAGYLGLDLDRIASKLAISPTISGGGGNGNHGGNVLVEATAGSRVETSGAGSIGIFAQSVGGGGGYSGSLLGEGSQGQAILGTGKSGGGGNGGAVSVTSSGPSVIITSGAAAHGIFAQSVGGGGGLPGSISGVVEEQKLGATREGARGRGGPVTIDWTGTISATGDDSRAIYAQSGVQTTTGAVKAGTGGKISINVNGDVTGGAGSGVAIRIDGGSGNTIDIAGGTVSALSGTAIRETNALVGSAGFQGINNAGTLIGNVHTSVRTELRNFTSGLFFPGATVQARVENLGTMNVAGPGEIGKTTVESFTQSDRGVWQVDVDPEKGKADHLHSKGAVSLGGKVAPVFISPVRRPFEKMAILTSDGTLSSRAGVEGPRVLDLDVDGQTAYLAVNFNKGHAVEGLDLTDNEKEAADHLQDLWEGGHLGKSRDLVLHFLGIGSAEEYQAALQDLSSESHAVVGAITPSQTFRMQKSLHSFPVFVGDTAQLSETSGVATRYTFSYLEQGSEGQISGYRQWSNAFEVNGQARLLDDWFLGGAIIYDRSFLAATDGESSGTGDSFFFGGILKKILFENLLLSASIGYSFGVFDQEREVTYLGTRRTADAEQYVHTLSSRIRAAYNVDLGKWYVRPEFGVDFVYVDIPGYQETGGGMLNMEYDAQSDFQVGLTPAVEIGGRVDFKGGFLRPFGRAGLTWWSNSNWEQTARLAAVDAASDITTSYDAASLIGHGEVGFDCVFDNGIEIRAQYDIDGADDFISHSVSGRVGFRF